MSRFRHRINIKPLASRRVFAHRRRNQLIDIETTVDAKRARICVFFEIPYHQPTPRDDAHYRALRIAAVWRASLVDAVAGSRRQWYVIGGEATIFSPGSVSAWYVP